MLAVLGLVVIGCAEIVDRGLAAVDTGQEQRDLFSCPNVYHRGGDAIRCGDKGRSGWSFIPSTSHVSVA
jgi:hypothetical protein